MGHHHHLQACPGYVGFPHLTVDTASSSLCEHAELYEEACMKTVACACAASKAKGQQA